jgi:hypothetical protein
LGPDLSLVVGHDGGDALDVLDRVGGLAVGHVDAERLHERGALRMDVLGFCFGGSGGGCGVSGVRAHVIARRRRRRRPVSLLFSHLVLVDVEEALLLELVELHARGRGSRPAAADRGARERGQHRESRERGFLPFETTITRARAR